MPNENYIGTVLYKMENYKTIKQSTHFPFPSVNYIWLWLNITFSNAGDICFIDLT
jgi:hypothetical protein